MLQTLSKWSAKIQAVAPSALLPSNRGAFLKGNQTLKSAVQLVDESLADGAKLLARTQVPRVKKPRIGVLRDDESAAAEADSDAPDPEMFDDTDFYQKMLRDIIEARGEGNKNEDWALLQKQKKAKKKVDTKASKGRKLRYVRGQFCPTLHELLTFGISPIGMKFMKRFKTLWYLCLFPVHGMMSRLTSSLLRCLGKVLRMLLSILRSLGW